MLPKTPTLRQIWTGFIQSLGHAATTSRITLTVQICSVNTNHQIYHTVLFPLYSYTKDILLCLNSFGLEMQCIFARQNIYYNTTCRAVDIWATTFKVSFSGSHNQLNHWTNYEIMPWWFICRNKHELLDIKANAYCSKEQTASHD